MRTAIAGLIGALTLFGAGAASAHHSYVMFDVQREVDLHGVVKDFQWGSPHVRVDLLVRDAAGKPTEWSIECASPSTLRRFGWGRDSMKAGDQIDIIIHPRKDGSVGGSLVKVTINGQLIGDPRTIQSEHS